MPKIPLNVLIPKNWLVRPYIEIVRADAVDVHFIAVNYFGAGSCPALLDSLRTQQGGRWRLTVVDNSESDAEHRRLSEIARHVEAVRVVRAPRNLGYFGAANWLLDAEDGPTATWTVVSNMDVRYGDTNFVRGLADLDGVAEVVAPSIIDQPEGRPRNPYMINRPSVRSMWRRRVMLGNPVTAQLTISASLLLRGLRQRRAATQAPGQRAIYAPYGACIAFHERYFAAGGNLAHPTFLFNEEITVAEQCHRLGLTVLFVPALTVVHDAHQATGRLRSWRVLRAQGEAARYGYRLISDNQDKRVFSRLKSD